MDEIDTLKRRIRILELKLAIERAIHVLDCVWNEHTDRAKKQLSDAAKELNTMDITEDEKKL